MPEALARAQSDATVRVATAPWLTFTPTTAPPATGFILYPGGRVDARHLRARGPRHRREGYLVVIAPMPFNLAVFKPAAAQAVIAAHPEIADWAIGGHSLGGAMAANFVFTHPDAAQGLVLWAAYPAGNNSLADRRLAVASICGTATGWRRRARWTLPRPLLPADTSFVAIEGGNHAQMGGPGHRAATARRPLAARPNRRRWWRPRVALLAGLGG